MSTRENIRLIARTPFNLEAVASLCAILFSHASVFVHIGSIL